jgi:hypothetical protein
VTEHLDPDAEQFIQGWASVLPGSATPALLVHVEDPPGASDEGDAGSACSSGSSSWA